MNEEEEEVKVKIACPVCGGAILVCHDYGKTLMHKEYFFNPKDDTVTFTDDEENKSSWDWEYHRTIKCLEDSSHKMTWEIKDAIAEAIDEEDCE